MPERGGSRHTRRAEASCHCDDRYFTQNVQRLGRSVWFFNEMYQLMRFFLTDRDLIRSVQLTKNCSMSEILGLDEK
jgi:hypothetical protein